jgi:predicted O-methyltransferase YrrM
MGFHVTPVHYYMPIPDTRSLKPTLWEKQSQLIGIDLNDKEQQDLLSSFSVYKEEYNAFPKTQTSLPYQYFVQNKSYGSVDGEILYSMVRSIKPKKILEIGSGFSTMVTAQAIKNNQTQDPSYSCYFEAVDPYPNKTLQKGFPGLSRLNKVEVEDLPLAGFESLEANDILFIDSSHVLRIGNDVEYLYLEVLPRLKKGVIIQIHDIFLPAQYPQNAVLKQHLFWSEQYLLQAFLAFNPNFKVLWAGSFMHLKHPELLEASFNSYNRNRCWPGSFWMQKTN